LHEWPTKAAHYPAQMLPRRVRCYERGGIGPNRTDPGLARSCFCESGISSGGGGIRTLDTP